MTEQSKIEAKAPRAIPEDFVFDAEHPILPIPFNAQLDDEKLDGVGLSVAAAYVKAPGELDPKFEGSKHVVKLQFDFEGFTITLFPEVKIAQGKNDDEIALQFMNPTGPHLPQLRYIINSFIAGDFVSMRSMLAYTGPTAPKDKVNNDTTKKSRKLKSFGVAIVSALLIAGAGAVLHNRLTTSTEARPVFITRSGSEMRATTAGQVAFLNPDAKSGEVVYSIAANSGDVLNFKLPCDCQVSVTQGIFEGATVLPIDSILTFFGSTVEVRVQTQMSIEGLAKAMNGEKVFLDLEGSKSVPVEVVVTGATNAAAQRGDPYLPVTLVAEQGALTGEDIGKPARVRLKRPLFVSSLIKSITEQS